MGFLLHKIQHILMHLVGPFLWAQTSLYMKSDQKVTEEANQEEKTVCSQAKDKPWMMSTGLVWPCQRTFHIKTYLIFICYFKKTGKKSNTQKRAMKIMHSNFASWEQNNLWPKCFFKKKIHICIPIRWDYFFWKYD